MKKTISKEISNEEYFQISDYLQDMHEIFYKFWNLSKPVFDDSLPTAGVYFNQDGEYIQFKFNSEFWAKLKTSYNRAFVIAHECLHVILNHGRRAKPKRKPPGFWLLTTG